MENESYADIGREEYDELQLQINTQNVSYEVKGVSLVSAHLYIIFMICYLWSSQDKRRQPDTPIKVKKTEQHGVYLSNDAVLILHRKSINERWIK